MTLTRSLTRPTVRKKKTPGFVERRGRDALADIPAGSTYYDHKFDTMVHKINEGGFCVLSRSEHVILTTLGSCISVCMFDPVIKVGGMNHFLLPEERHSERKNNFCMRYGNNAMEILLNEILKRGGQKDRIVLKAFGAGNVLSINANIGEKNQNFLKKYITDESMKLETCDLGGDLPRRVAFFPGTGKAFVKLLRRAGDRNIGRQEEKYRHKIESQHASGDIELF
ncbi:MAG: chemotaxis protein CheD [Alphaproteobacteria bacterium]|nr:MAG: chemotaxis protein CheD [Alphaproteobacteria bacterium]